MSAKNVWKFYKVPISFNQLIYCPHCLILLCAFNRYSVSVCIYQREIILEEFILTDLPLQSRFGAISVHRKAYCFTEWPTMKKDRTIKKLSYPFHYVRDINHPWAISSIIFPSKTSFPAHSIAVIQITRFNTTIPRRGRRGRFALACRYRHTCWSP